MNLDQDQVRIHSDSYQQYLYQKEEFSKLQERIQEQEKQLKKQKAELEAEQTYLNMNNVELGGYNQNRPIPLLNQHYQRKVQVQENKEDDCNCNCLGPDCLSQCVLCCCVGILQGIFQ